MIGGAGDRLGLEGVHALVCDEQQAVSILSVLGVDGGSEAGGDDRGSTGQDDGALERALNRVDAVADGAVIGERGGEDNELVSAKAGEGVGRVEGVAEVAGDLAQDLVAGMVSERIVDLLEAVEVEQQQGERWCRCGGQ